MSEPKWRGARSWAVAVVLTTTAIVAANDSVNAQQEPPASVFDVSPSLAIEAARTRLRLFVDDNPEAAEGTVVADLPECPLISVESINDVASVVGQERGADLRLQLDPWLGRTTSDPELRPDSAAAGEVEGIPIVRCDSTRPVDGQVTRPALFAINLTGGVTFGDVVRLYGLEGVLAAQPADIGGQQVGSCFGTDDTATCVVLWSSRSLVLGLTLEGPPTAVNTSTAGAALTAAVPTVINSLAVVVQPAPVCSAETIAAETGVVLLGEPLCADGWAFGTTVECPPPETTTSTTTTGDDTRLTRGIRSPAVFGIEDCAAVDVFHVEPEGWNYDGSFDTTCTENLARLGMTAVTAREVAPVACDEDDPSLASGSIRPGQQGTRVAALQVALVNLGYVLPVDGRYGPLTEAAVVDFQLRNGIDPIGIAGPRTRGTLGI
jgi:Putative peptidoglycan binding domain